MARSIHLERHRHRPDRLITLLGAGEYVAGLPDAVAPGHFGVAVKDYAHSTAPMSAAAMLLESRIGEQFAALVTGAFAKGTWARRRNDALEGGFPRRIADIRAPGFRRSVMRFY